MISMLSLSPAMEYPYVRRIPVEAAASKVVSPIRRYVKGPKGDSLAEEGQRLPLAWGMLPARSR